MGSVGDIDEQADAVEQPHAWGGYMDKREFAKVRCLRNPSFCVDNSDPKFRSKADAVEKLHARGGYTEKREVAKVVGGHFSADHSEICSTGRCCLTTSNIQ